ncbi:EscU/YscU/HrcU family type III secretion system export apparatus switch protein [Tigheibacillus jepli]|uniref:EscU/YscU/HrcU family type III secretion system export apparatus switch protein n=1 Tax=Tigheibacillus jepli TaxID=3035914 RepID=UPI00387E0F5C
MIIGYDEPTEAGSCTEVRCQKNGAPQVTASGKGKIADNIIAKATENNVPIVEDASLASLLGELNINEAIPTELYQAVAEVFAFIYQVDERMSEMTEK